MKVARLVACGLMVSWELSIGTALWAQMSFGEFVPGDFDGGGVGSAATVGAAWTSLSQQPSGIVLDASTELSLTDPGTLSSRRAAAVEPDSDEPFSLAQHVQSEVMVSGVVATASQHVSVASAAEIVRPTAVWTSSAAELDGGSRQLLDLGNASENLQPLSLSPSAADALLEKDHGPAWLPTAEVR